MSDVAGHGKQLPSAEREQQLRMELQQVDHQISQQTQMRGLEVGTICKGVKEWKRERWS